MSDILLFMVGDSSAGGVLLVYILLMIDGFFSVGSVM